jgi:uncharacterized RDD family membrane protein YckC
MTAGVTGETPSGADSPSSAPSGADSPSSADSPGAAPIEPNGRRMRDVPAVARGYQGHRAGVVTRILGCVVDGLVIFGLLALLWLGAFGVSFLFNSTRAKSPNPGLLLNITTGSIVAAVYFASAWWTTGRTYGAHLLGLRVVDHHGGRPTVPIAALRALFCVVFPIGLLWAAVSRQNRSVQDLVLRTSVIYDWVAQPEQSRHGHDTVL